MSDFARQNIQNLQRRGRLTAPLRGDLLDLVDEDDRVLQIGNLEKGLPERPGQTLGVPGQPRREHLDERPVEPGGDGLGEGGRAPGLQVLPAADPELISWMAWSTDAMVIWLLLDGQKSESSKSGGRTSGSADRWTQRA